MTLTEFVKNAYSTYFDPVVVESKRNPHLDHDCESPEYEVQARCHEGHVYEKLHTVQYNKKGDQCLVAETTCGEFSVWMD